MSDDVLAVSGPAGVLSLSRRRLSSNHSSKRTTITPMIRGQIPPLRLGWMGISANCFSPPLPRLSRIDGCAKSRGLPTGLLAWWLVQRLNEAKSRKEEGSKQHALKRQGITSGITQKTLPTTVDIVAFESNVMLTFARLRNPFADRLRHLVRERVDFVHGRIDVRSYSKS